MLGSVPAPGSAARAAARHPQLRLGAEPGAERLGDRGYVRTLRGYVTGVLTQFRNDDRILGWDLWNEPDNPADTYASVERKDKLDLVANLLPRCSSGRGWSIPASP